MIALALVSSILFAAWQITRGNLVCCNRQNFTIGTAVTGRLSGSRRFVWGAHAPCVLCQSGSDLRPSPQCSDQEKSAMARAPSPAREARGLPSFVRDAKQDRHILLKYDANCREVAGKVVPSPAGRRLGCGFQSSKQCSPNGPRVFDDCY